MPVSTSAKKALRRDRRRKTVNQKIISLVKRQVAAFRRKPSKAALPKLYQAIDRAVKKNIIHPNKGARLKSRLSGRLQAKTNKRGL